MVHVFYTAHLTASASSRLSRLKDIGLAMAIYEDKNDNRLPPAEHWNRAIGFSDDEMKTVQPNGAWLWPSLRIDAPYCCAYNRFVVGRKVDDLDPNSPAVVDYLAQRPDQVTEAEPKLVELYKTGLAAVDGQARNMYPDLVEKALENSRSSAKP